MVSIPLYEKNALVYVQMAIGKDNVTDKHYVSDAYTI